MQRKLLIIICLLTTVGVAFAEKKKKGEQRTGDPVAAWMDKYKPKDTTVKINYKEIGSPLPPFMIKIVKGKEITDQYLTQKDVANDANLFIMEFNPTCEHCQDETVLLGQNADLFKKSKIILMAAYAMDSYMEFFENVTKASEHPKLQLTIDNQTSDFINKTFIYKSLPQINIYDKERKLIKIFTSDTPIDSLKPYIQ